MRSAKASTLARTVSIPSPRREASSYGPAGLCLFEIHGRFTEVEKPGGSFSFVMSSGDGPGCVYAPQVTASWIHLISYPAQGSGYFQFTVDPNPSNVPRAAGIRVLNDEHLIFQNGAPSTAYFRLFSASPGATFLVNGVPTPTPAIVLQNDAKPVKLEAPSIWTVNEGERRIFQKWSNLEPRIHYPRFAVEFRYLYATFETQFLLNTTANGPGTVATTPFYPDGYHPGGATIILQARPAPGAVFSGWSGAVSGMQNPTLVGMSMPRNVVANFIPDPNAPSLSLETPPPPLVAGRQPESLTATVTVISGGAPVALGPPTVRCPVDPSPVSATLPGSGTTPAVVQLAVRTETVALHPRGTYTCHVEVPRSGFAGQPPAEFDVNVTLDRPAESGQEILAVVNGASFMPGPLSPGGIFSVFGTGLADVPEEATVLPLPTSMRGTRLRLRNSLRSWDLPLFYVSPTQVNILVPDEIPYGSATLTLYLADVAVSSLAVTIEPVSPAVFSANSDGKGAPAGQFIRLSGERQVRGDLYQCRQGERCVTNFIDWGGEDEELSAVFKRLSRKSA